MAIIALTLMVRVALLPLTLKQFKSMQSMARLQPEIKKLQEQVQERQGAPQPGDDALLPGEQGEPVRLVPPDGRAAAGLPVALLHAAQAICGTTSARRSTLPERANPVPCGDGGDAQFLFIPDLTNRAYGYVLVILIVLYVGSQLLSTLLMATTTDKTQRMIFLALPVLLRALRLAVPGRPARLLDHDEPVDHRAAGDRPEAARAAATTGPGAESLSDMIGRISGRKDEDDDDKGAAARSDATRRRRPARGRRSPSAARNPRGGRAGHRRLRRGGRRSAPGGVDE